MRKLDRLLAIVTILQSKNVVTARELAQRFDISVRTVYRDIRTIETAGIPIGAETGLGYFLVDGYTLPPVVFTTEEIGALLIAEKVTCSFVDDKTKTNLAMAINKVRAVLNDKHKDWISKLEKRILAFSSVDTNTQDNDIIHKIQKAIYEKNIVEIQYTSPEKNEITRRLIEPVSILFSEQHWYMIAYCHSRNAYRVFRVDRIEKFRTTENQFKHSHPDNESIMKEILESKPLQKVVIRIKNDQNCQGFRRKIFSGLIGEERMGERVELSFFTDSLPVLGKWLLFSDCDVEIIQPDELKDRMRQFANEIADRYRN